MAHDAGRETHPFIPDHVLNKYMTMLSPIQVREVSVRQLRQMCSTCSLRELCLPIGLSQEEMRQLDSIICQGRHIKRGEGLYRAG